MKHRGKCSKLKYEHAFIEGLRPLEPRGTADNGFGNPFRVLPRSRGALGPHRLLARGGKDCVLPCIHLLYIKRLDRQIALRFGMAEVRINAGSSELCDRLIEAFRDLKVQRVSHSETLQVSVAFAVVEQALHEV
jgi:hypothetical protein